MFNGGFEGLHRGKYQGMQNDVSPGIRVGQYGEVPTLSNNYNYCEEAEYLFSRMTTKPPEIEKMAIRKVIIKLKRAGIWQKMDLWQMYAAGNEVSCRTNWVNPLLYTGTNPSGSTPWTAYIGYTGGTVPQNRYIDTGFNPATNAVNYTLNSGCHGGYIRGVTTGNKVSWGITSGSGALSYIVLYPLTGGVAYPVANITDASFISGYSEDGTGGLVVAQVNNSSNQTPYKNGIIKGSFTTAQSFIPNGPDYVLARNFIGGGASTHSDATVSLRFYCGKLTAEQHRILYLVVQEYLSTFSTQII